MNNVVPFRRKQQPVSSPVRNESVSSNDAFMSMVNAEAAKLGSLTDKTPEEAIKMASDMYSTYPMLIEHVRSVEYMTRDKKK